MRCVTNDKSMVTAGDIAVKICHLLPVHCSPLIIVTSVKKLPCSWHPDTNHRFPL